MRSAAAHTDQNTYIRVYKTGRGAVPDGCRGSVNDFRALDVFAKNVRGSLVASRGQGGE